MYIEKVYLIPFASPKFHLKCDRSWENEESEKCVENFLNGVRPEWVEIIDDILNEKKNVGYLVRFGDMSALVHKDFSYIYENYKISVSFEIREVTEPPEGIDCCKILTTDLLRFTRISATISSVWFNETKNEWLRAYHPVDYLKELGRM